MNWNDRCLKSIRREKAEVAEKYGIRFGQTETYCARCGKSWGLGNHTCQDRRLKKLHEKEVEKQEVLKNQNDNFLGDLRKIGAKKISTISFDSKNGGFISEKTISQWIYRGNIPSKYVDRIEGLINSLIP